jgi:hypothetical protein
MDDKLVPILLPGQALPGGTMSDFGGFGGLTDAGASSFRARRKEDPAGRFGAYVWEAGTITPVALPGAEVPGGGKIVHVNSVFSNSKNPGLLVVARVQDAGGASAVSLWRFTEGKLVPLTVPGQEMPGGGTLRGIPEDGGLSGNNSLAYISPANAAGEHAFIANLQDGGRGVYRVDPEGRLSLILKEGAATELGNVTRVQGWGVALNTQGQVLLALRIGDRPNAIVLLTPATP